MGKKIADIAFAIAILVVLVLTVTLRFQNADSADVIDVNFAINIVTLVALLYLGRGYIVNQAHRQEDESRDRTLAIQDKELEALNEANERLTAELNAVREKTAGDVAHLSGKVEQLTVENASLRQLVMLDKVPPAMIEVLHNVAGDATAAMVQAVEDRIRPVTERLGPIEQAIGRLVEQQLLQHPDREGGET